MNSTLSDNRAFSLSYYAVVFTIKCKYVYQKLLEWIGKLFTFPLVALFYVIAKPCTMFMVWDLKRARASFKPDLTGSNYKQTRLKYDRFKEVIDNARKITQLDDSRLNFFARSLLRDFKRMSVTALEIHDIVGQAFSTLDKPDGELFKNISESELWNNRTTAYDYLL